MNVFHRIINAVGNPSKQPSIGRMIAPRREDSIRDYPGAGLTPSRLIAILREADDGSLSTAMQLFEEMEEKDAHLYSVANTRRLALTGLEWQVISAADVRESVDRTPAGETAHYCRQVLAEMDSFDEGLQHLALAMGRNVSIAEVVWENIEGEVRPIALAPVDFTRIVFTDNDQVRILTAEEPQDGIELPLHKFVVHTPHNVSGHPQRGGLLRVTAMVYLAKNLSLKDWMIFAEVFGMPVRIARYEPTATPEEKRELVRMLETLGSNAAGIFSRAVDLQIIDSNRGTSAAPYENLIEFLNREMSKAWLGQTLTTDITGQSGSIAASRVHEQVRQDILADDIRKEGRTIRRDLLTPLVQLRFGPNAPIPYFRRRIKDTLDRRQWAEVIGLAVNELGAKVPSAWFHEIIGVPHTDDPAAALPGNSKSARAR